MLVAPGVPNGTPATTIRHARHHDDALAHLRKPFLKGKAAGAVDHVVLIADILRNHAVHAPYQGQLAAGRNVWRNRHDRRPRPLAGDPQRSGAGRGPAHDRIEIEGFGDLARRSRYRVGARCFRLGALSIDDVAVGRIGLNLHGDAVHGGDGLHRELAGRRFRRQHHRIGTLVDRGGDVGHLGPCGHRA